MPQKTVVVEGYTYTIDTLPTGQAMPVFVILTRVLGATLASLATAPVKTQDAAMAQAFRGLCERLTAEDLATVSAAFAGATTVNGAKLALTFDAHFAGRFGALFQWLHVCIEHNFSDFFVYAGNVSASLSGASEPKNDAKQGT